MSTNELRSQGCIGSENSCLLCGAGDPDRFAMPDDRPSLYLCLSCAPAAGEPPREWFEREVRPVIDA